MPRGSVSFNRLRTRQQAHPIVFNTLLKFDISLEVRCSLWEGRITKMKKFIAGVVVGFVASGGVGIAAQSFDHNGVFWNKLNNAAKTGYINGYGDAMQVSAGKLDSLSIAADLFHWRGANKIIKQLTSELSTRDLTPELAVKKLDTLYANSKYSELDLGQALQLLAARAPVDGAGDDSPAPVKTAPKSAPKPAHRSTK
jgi:hypothetical protein